MRRSYTLLAILAAITLGAGSVHAEGFGTPTIDGVIDGVYGAAEATDPSGELWNGLTNLDLTNLYVCNDNTFWYFAIEVNADIAATAWAKYIIDIDVTNDTDGGTSDAWARPVLVNDPHKPEYSLRSWVDNLPYDPTDSQVWAWTQGTTSWAQTSTLDDVALAAGATSVLEWKVAKSKFGNPSTIWVEAWTTGGGGGDNAQDTSNDPAGDWDAIDWSSPATISVSTQVAEQSGGDTTPPTVTGYSYDALDRLVMHFSEPIDTLTAQIGANYSVTGEVVIGAVLNDASSVELILGSDMSLGSCIDAEAINVKDLAGNAIVDNNVTNVTSLFLTELHIRGQMSIHLQSHTFFPAIDTFAIEGSIFPLTWDPTCDDLLLDGGTVDSVYEATLVFASDCGVVSNEPDTVTLEYKFTHQCTEWEGVSNHVYELNMGVPIDTLDIWWDNQAPIDFTDKDIDVIFNTISSLQAPFVPGDTLAVNGSISPLSWDTPPFATSIMADDGVLPDTTAADGRYTKRMTFPAGSLKNFEYKYLLKEMGDTLWVFECDFQPNRSIFLNDTLFSTSSPIVLDLQWFDICRDIVGIDAGEVPSRFSLLQNVPNPFNPTTVIEFELPEAARVNLSIYDASGRLVRRLVDRELPAGTYSGSRGVIWSGTDDRGMSVASGVYFYSLDMGGEKQTRKMVLVR